ncbi:HNH endonuclease [Piscirickettsia salmonis]|uniref:HNH endonuclease n=1 Tax=Piscirickettsia salmonis TaxID=1238 RepID=UPI0012BB1C68|nr:HNH endonuclease [Piscirickettsia salmonis]
MAEPLHDYNQALIKCIAGISRNEELKNKLCSNKKALLEKSSNYVIAAEKGQLYIIQPIISNNEDCVVLNTLKKDDLIKLYTQYLVNKEKPGRDVYNALLSIANEKCSFCGGIGRPMNLDHFLPKAHFPQFSVLPKNLIPSCLDCNTVNKKNIYAKEEKEQIIHPYLDHEKFFSTQWVFAKYQQNNKEPSTVDYFVKPPSNWNDVDKQRVKSHFEFFDLRKRYSIQAAEELIYAEEQIKRLLDKDISPEEILLYPARSTYFVNHWKAIMYQELINKFQI